MINKTISYLVISDIHLGHPKNKTEDIAECLRSYFVTYNDVFKSLDIIFIAGDVYDSLLQHYSNDTIAAGNVLERICYYCLNNNIKLRILEGTPSHDWRQVKTFYTGLGSLNDRLDFKYVENLSIEHIDDLGLDILYVPDEWKETTEEVWNDVVNELSDKGLDKVDITIMHGMFEYQTPNGVSLDAHEEKRYLDITRYYINIGHIHTMSSYGRILAQGSFDRLRHGEEEKKGGLVMTINPNGNMSYTFYENKCAKIFKTIRVATKEMDKLIGRLDKVIKKYPIGSHIRLSFTKNNPLIQAFKDIRFRYPGYFLTKVTDGDSKNDNNILFNRSVNKESFNQVEITEDNIVDMVIEELGGDGYPSTDAMKLEEEIRGC